MSAKRSLPCYFYMLLKGNGNKILCSDLQTCICAYLEACQVFRSHWNEQIWSSKCHGRGIMRYPIVLYLTKFPKSLQENPVGKIWGKSFYCSFISFQFIGQMNSIFIILSLFFFLFFLITRLVIHYSTWWKVKSLWSEFKPGELFVGFMIFVT